MPEGEPKYLETDEATIPQDKVDPWISNVSEVLKEAAERIRTWQAQPWDLDKVFGHL